MQEISLLEKAPAEQLGVTTAGGTSCCTHFMRKEDIGCIG
jgi:hypothetical protein